MTRGLHLTPSATQVPSAFPVCFTPLHFYKRTTLVPVFTNQKKSDGDFHFYRKKKAKITFSMCSARSRYRGSTHPGSQWHRQAPFPGTNPAPQHPAATALNCEHLRFVSIYSVYLLARRVIRQLLLRFTPFRLTKTFLGTRYCQTVGITCVLISLASTLKKGALETL